MAFDQVKDIIQSYKISSLVAQYVEGTRQWLNDDINKWLDVATASTSDDKSSRMFLLLAGPGMGKSVFSAVMHTHLMARPDEKSHVKMVRRGDGREDVPPSLVRAVGCNQLDWLLAKQALPRVRSQVKHFFKAGESRSQGRAMVVSLAYQVAERLPGFAVLLLPVAQEHGTGTELPLMELFQR